MTQIASLNPSLLAPLTLPASAQQARQARRLYVGNIPPAATELELMDFLNAALSTTTKGLATPVVPVVAVQVNREKAFAFVEFRTPEEATAGMAFDGLMMHGHALKIRRPTDYRAPLEGAPAAASPSISIPGIISTNVPDGPNKLFIGGLPSFLTEEHVKHVLVSFGQLKSFNLVKDPLTGLSKGYAFFEYVDPSATDIACKGLHGTLLGDKTLMVQRALLGAKQPCKPSTLSPSGRGSTMLATKVVQLLNMVTADDLRDEEEYADIKEDIQEECNKLGKVQSIAIPRPSDTTSTENTTKEQGVGKVFVEFEQVEDAVKAHAGLSGRKFAGRTVVATFYNEADYAQGVFNI